MKVTEISISNEEEWKYIHKSKSEDLYLSWDYCQIISDKYKLGIKLLLIEDNNSGVLLTYTKRSKKINYFDVFTPYGMGGFEIWGKEKQKVLNNLFKYLKSNNVVTYYFSCSSLQKKKIPEIYMDNRTIYNISLDSSKELLWKDLHKNHKYEIKKFEKNNLRVIKEKLLLKQEFAKLYFETIKRVNATNTYHYNNSTLEKLLNSNICKLIGASLNNKIVCIVLFLRYGDNAEYFINASSLDGRNASRKLIWEMIIDLKEEGVRIVNMGGGIKEGDFLDDFKRRFGGIPEKTGKISGVINQEKFDELCAKYNNNKNSIYFPPYWA